MLTRIRLTGLVLLLSACPDTSTPGTNGEDTETTGVDASTGDDPTSTTGVTPPGTEGSSTTDPSGESSGSDSSSSGSSGGGCMPAVFGSSVFGDACFQ